MGARFEVVWKPHRRAPICSAQAEDEDSAMELFATLAAEVWFGSCLWCEFWAGDNLEDHRERESGTCRALAGARRMVETAFAPTEGKPGG